ncbi:hypothetical protein H6A09_01455 [[Clostridium] spiroforme]|nr:hypothetical protein [Thomasclavelia spiroformis]
MKKDECERALNEIINVLKSNNFYALFNSTEILRKNITEYFELVKKYEILRKNITEYFELVKKYEILKEKITSKKPNFEGDGYDESGNMMYDTWICPNCDKHYELDYEEYDYCPNCGQRIDWSEEDE